MPHTGTPPSKKFRGHDPLGGVKGEVISGLERRFVPGVAAEICRRPYDRPRAETHPPNASMNVYLVDSARVRPESWRLMISSSTPRAYRPRFVFFSGAP